MQQLRQREIRLLLDQLLHRGEGLGLQALRQLRVSQNQQALGSCTSSRTFNRLGSGAPDGVAELAESPAELNSIRADT